MLYTAILVLVYHPDYTVLQQSMAIPCSPELVSDSGVAYYYRDT